jgi:hypothetical protein
MKAAALILLLANVLLGFYIYAVESAPAPSFAASNELHPERMRPVPLETRPETAAVAKAAETPPKLIREPAPGATQPGTCVQWGAIVAADLERARQRIAARLPQEHYSEQRVESASRYWIYIPPRDNAQAAELMVAQLRKAGITDVFAQPDHAISLGLYATEDTARRYRAQLAAKGFSEAAVEPRSSQVKEASFVFRDSGAGLATQLAELKAEFKGSQVRSAACPADIAVSQSRP